MTTLEDIAESRIREAIERGEFEGLPGAGSPVVLEDDLLVPEELRVAYRVLRNSGFVPPEIELRREIANVEALLRMTTAGERGPALRRLELLRFRLGQARGGETSLVLEEEYFAQIASRLGK